MLRAIAALLVGAGLALLSPPAHACSCASTTLEQQVSGGAVIVVASVGPARAESDGRRSSPLTFDAVLRGPAPAVAPSRVWWFPPDGRSCATVALRPGRWLLFLGWEEEGRLTTLRCDVHSRRLEPSVNSRRLRADVVRSLGAVTSEARAVELARVAVEPMLRASWVRHTDPAFITDAPSSLTLSAPLVSRDPHGAFVVRWQSQPTAGNSVDAEVRVAPDGVTTVMRADASFSPD